MNILSLLFPFRCLLCLAKADQPRDLCSKCQQELPWLTIACERCALPLPVAGHCGRCLKNPPAFQQVKALWRYENVVTQMVMGLKFSRKLVYARLMGELLANRFVEYYQGQLPEAIIPIPLHPKRLRSRGYNQALELAKPIAKLSSLPLETKRVQRALYTEEQAKLPLERRLRNVAEAFACRQILPFKHVAVVDDVVTTTATVEQFSQLLLKNGVKRVDVWCSARTAL